MKDFDLSVAWCWEFDKDLVGELDYICQKKGLSVYLIHPQNLKESLRNIELELLNFKVFFDRASDQQDEFEELLELVKSKGIRMINDKDHLKKATDKASMHLESISAGIWAPYTFILSPYEKQPELNFDQKQKKDILDKVGIPFVIKPACGGSGEGVVTNATGWEDIDKARMEFPEDKYLIQQKITPTTIFSLKMHSQKRAWFRVFYVCGEVILCFWDDQTQIADTLKKEDVGEKIFSEIENIVLKIADISKLELFSTEIAMDSSGKLLVIDHVNDQVDLRKKSKYQDGIPDEVVSQIVNRIADWVSNLRNL